MVRKLHVTPHQLQTYHNCGIRFFSCFYWSWKLTEASGQMSEVINQLLTVFRVLYRCKGDICFICNSPATLAPWLAYSEFWKASKGTKADIPLQLKMGHLAKIYRFYDHEGPSDPQQEVQSSNNRQYSLSTQCICFKCKMGFYYCCLFV